MNLNILNTQLLNNTFYQDKDPNWIKIDNVVIGESQKFALNVIKSKDLTSILNSNKGKIIVYDFKNSIAYLKSGFDLTNPKDYKIKQNFTSYVYAPKSLFGKPF